MTELEEKKAKELFRKEIVEDIEKFLDEDLSAKLLDVIGKTALEHGNGKGSTQKTFVSLAHATAMLLSMFTRMAKDQNEDFHGNVQDLGEDYNEFLKAFCFLCDHPEYEESQN